MFRKRGVRKAQITMFVILGLVLLILFLIIYFGVIKKAGEKTKTEIVPTEFRPVQQYVESCIHQVGIEAIKKMGVHGGYIDPLDFEISQKRLRFMSSQQTRFELASITGTGEGLVPYYIHVPGKASYLNYLLESSAPTIENMNSQLSAYISRELPKCTGEFEELKVRGGFNLEADNSNIITKAYIRDDRIEFIVNYKITAKKEGVIKTISTYQNTINFPLKGYYELAMMMARSEVMTQFLESFTTSLIAYHSGLNTGMLPPIVEYTNDYYVLAWSNIKVKNDINSLLLSYTPALQVNGTNNYQNIAEEGDNDVEAKFFKSLSLDMFNGTMPNVSISFFYPPDTLSSKVQPSKGDIIKPNVEVTEGNKFLPKSQFNTYRFFYDVAYPVIVEIRGEDSDSEISSYSFLFALESNLIENKPVLAWNLGMNTVDWDYSYLNTTHTMPDFDEEGNDVIITPQSPAKKLFCEESTWLSGNISVRTENAITSAPVEGVIVSFGCGDYDECWLGETRMTEDGSSAEWVDKMPVCTGGYLSLSKEGYGSQTVLLTTEEGIDVTVEPQRIYQMKELIASVKKREITKVYTRYDDWAWEAGEDSLGNEQELDSLNEQVGITITQTGFEAGSSPISQYVLWGYDAEPDQTISLVPGEYEISASLSDNTGFTIPGNCSRVCKGLDAGWPFGCIGGYQYFPDDDTEMIPAYGGGVEINEGTTGTFRITPWELENANHIEFKVFKLPNLAYSNPPFACIDALEETDWVGNYSIKYQTYIMPVLS